ncbi:hypothetical protein HWI79_3475 [Cryptosporidium felis]|nr:hypothetical protein HWI79_3475 [Cryptosporidium felis]
MKIHDFLFLAFAALSLVSLGSSLKSSKQGADLVGSDSDSGSDWSSTSGSDSNPGLEQSALGPSPTSGGTGVKHNMLSLSNSQSPKTQLSHSIPCSSGNGSRNPDSGTKGHSSKSHSHKKPRSGREATSGSNSSLRNTTQDSKGENSDSGSSKSSSKKKRTQKGETQSSSLPSARSRAGTSASSTSRRNGSRASRRGTCRKQKTTSNEQSRVSKSFDSSNLGKSTVASTRKNSFRNTLECCMLLDELLEIGAKMVKLLVSVCTEESEFLLELLQQMLTAYSIIHASLSACKQKLSTLDPGNPLGSSITSGLHLDEDTVKNSKALPTVTSASEYENYLTLISIYTEEKRDVSVFLSKVDDLKYMDQQCKLFALDAARKALTTILSSVLGILNSELEKVKLAINIYTVNEKFSESMQLLYDDYVLGIGSPKVAEGSEGSDEEIQD